MMEVLCDVKYLYVTLDAYGTQWVITVHVLPEICFRGCIQKPSEALSDQVVAESKARGWQWAHQRTCMTKKRGTLNVFRPYRGRSTWVQCPFKRM